MVLGGLLFRGSLLRASRVAGFWFLFHSALFDGVRCRGSLNSRASGLVNMFLRKSPARLQRRTSLVSGSVLRVSVKQGFWVLRPGAVRSGVYWTIITIIVSKPIYRS